jgi:hypothetical protein
LTAITSAASGLRDAGPLNAAQATLAAELDEATTRLNRLVRNLLDLSRLEAGHLRPNPDWHDVRDLVHTTMQNLGRTLAEHLVKVEIPAELPLVKLDFALTEQILANLFSNAAVHTPAGTTIELRARAEPTQLVLEVADHGPGLSLGNPARLFDRFQRGINAAGPGEQESVVACERFCRSARRHCDCGQSRWRRRNFHCAIAAHSNAARASREGMSEPNKTLVLVIDDEPQIRRLLTVTLEANAYRVLTAMSGKEGLVLAAQSSTRRHHPRSWPA